MATCVVYICLTVIVKEHLLAYSLSYVIVLRLWRLGRVYHGQHIAVIYLLLLIIHHTVSQKTTGYFYF